MSLAERQLLAEQNKQRFLDTLASLPEFKPTMACKIAKIDRGALMGWLQTDNDFRTKYDVFKAAWIGEITWKAEKTLSLRMFQKGKEWLLIQWLKVHDEVWRSANRQQLNSFTQINLLTNTRGKPETLKIEAETKEIARLSPEEQAQAAGAMLNA